MELSNKVIKGVRNVRAIIFAVILVIVGLIFAAIGVYSFIKPSEGDNKIIVNILFVVLGLIAAVAGVFMIIRSIKTLKSTKPLTKEQVRENEAKLNATEPKFENIKNQKLFFHFGGKLNQSYFVEDKNGKTLYECRMVKFNPFTNDTYEFVDVEHNYSKTLKIGKTLSSGSEGSGIPFIGDTDTSRFKIDGVMCWDYLYQRGYELKHLLQGKTLTRYELIKLGTKVAEIVPTTIKDPFNEDNTNFFLMGKGVYRIEIIDAKLEDAVMAAFIVAKTEIIE